MGNVFTLSRAIVQSDLTHCPRRSAERATRTSSAARGGRLGRFTSLRLSGRERSQSSQSNRPNARSPMPPRVMLTASTAQSTRSGSEMLSRRSDSPLDTRVTDSGPPPAYQCIRLGSIRPIVPQFPVVSQRSAPSGGDFEMDMPGGALSTSSSPKGKKRKRTFDTDLGETARG